MRQNNKPVTRYGIGFQSTNELVFYEALKKMGVDFSFQHEIVLAGPKTFYKNVKTTLLKSSGAERLIMLVDFVFKRPDGILYYCDTKGSKDSVMPLSTFKYNLLKHRLASDGLQDTTQIKFIYQKQVNELSLLAKFSSPAEFWKKFHSIPAF